MRAIVLCGPNRWYRPFTEMMNSKRISLRHLFVFHMDECLDWQGHPLPTNFRTIFVPLWRSISMRALRLTLRGVRRP